VNTFHDLPHRFGSLEMEHGVDPFDHEDAVLPVDLAAYVSRELSVARINVARLQRTSKCPRQSPARGGDDVIERRGVRGEVIRLHPVMLGDGPVDAEANRFGFSRKIGEPGGALHPFDPNVRDVDGFRHGSLPVMD